MALSSAFSAQAQMLSPAQLALIEEDYAKNPNSAGGPPMVKVGRNGQEHRGPLYASDAESSVQPFTSDETLIGPIGLPPAAAMLDKAGALSRVQPTTEDSADLGALSKTAVPRPAPPDIAAMLKQYIPEDNSQARYLALAQGLLAPTKTGSFGEQLSNVAGAMQQQRAEQEKTRAQYVPLIMQQVAAQQAREEQNQYRLEAQAQAQQAAKLAALQQQQARAEQAALERQAKDERDAANRTSRETIASNHNELMSTLKSSTKSDAPRLKLGERWNPDTQMAEAIPGSDLYQLQKSRHGKDYGTAQSINTSMDTSIGKIDEILDPKNTDAFNSNFGGYNAMATQFLPGASTDMRKKIEGLKSDLKMTGLNAIRAGGSIGAMTEKEWPIVEGMIARIDPTLSEEAARAELQKVKAYMERIRNNATDIYMTEWQGSPHYKGLGGPAKPDAAPPPAKPAGTPAVAPDLLAAAKAEAARRAGSK